MQTTPALSLGGLTNQRRPRAAASAAALLALPSTLSRLRGEPAIRCPLDLQTATQGFRVCNTGMWGVGVARGSLGC